MKLYMRKANGRYKEAGLKEVAEAYVCQTANTVGKKIGCPSDSVNFLNARLGLLEYEVFCLILLDNRHRIIEFVELFRGTIDSTTVYPREVVKECLNHNAAAVILAHNHPSGVAEPSEADKLITKRIGDALNLIDIRVLDHFVIGRGNTVSLAERGMM